MGYQGLMLFYSVLGFMLGYFVGSYMNLSDYTYWRDDDEANGRR